MKKLFFLGLITMVIIFQVHSQSGRNLGKIHFNGSPEIILSATESNGAFTYLLENESEKSQLFSFTLYENSYENFRVGIKQKLIGVPGVTEPAPEVLNRYFFYFQNQTHFQVFDESGALAMKMDFNDTLVAYGFKLANLSYVKKEDVADFLASLDYEKFDSEKFDSNPWDEETYAGLEFLKESKTDSNKTESELNFKDFKYKLTKIRGFRPRTLRWSELYKEIQFRYYQYFKYTLESKVDTLIKKGDQTLTERNVRIGRITNEINKLVLDSALIVDSIFTSTESWKKLEIEKLNYNNAITPLKIWILPDDFSIHDGNSQVDTLKDQYKNKFEEILKNANDKIKELGVKKSTILVLEMTRDSMISVLDEKYEENLRRLDSTIKAHDRYLLNEVRLRELESKKSNFELSLKNIQAQTAKKRDALKIENDSLKILKSTIQDSIKSELEALKKSNKFNFVPLTIQMEINKGYLENLVVEGDAFTFLEPSITSLAEGVTFSKTKIKFVNDYPLGISSKRDIERLGEIKIYSRNGDGKNNYEIRIGDLISNIVEILALDRTDYSPKDSVYSIKMKESSSIDFPKPNTKEILQMKVYSDFIGLKEENPNGLIQLEVDKEIPLVTKRISKPYVWSPFRWAINKYGNIGYFNFFRPRFVLSKVEDNNRYLPLEDFSTYNSSGEVIPPYKLGATTLDLKQYEHFVIGMDLNLLLYNIPYGKSTFLVNAGFHFGRTDFASYDSIPEKDDKPRGYTNTYQPSVEGVWRITGDERYGFEFAYGVNWLISDQLNFTQRSNAFDIDSFQEFEDSDKHYAIQRITLLAYLNVNQNREGRLFFRYRSNSQWRKFKNNYAQLQIGYTTSLVKRVD